MQETLVLFWTVGVLIKRTALDLIIAPVCTHALFVKKSTLIECHKCRTAAPYYVGPTFFYNSTIVESRPKTQILLESTACALRTISIVHPRHKTRLLNNCEAMGCLGQENGQGGKISWLTFLKNQKKGQGFWSKITLFNYLAHLTYPLLSNAHLL